MALSYKHAFVSAVPDGADATKIRPSNWNAEHTVTMATGRILGRSTASTGAVEEITPVGLTLSGGNLTAAPTVAMISDASANGRSLISAADYSAMRTLLTLVPGTDFLAVLPSERVPAKSMTAVTSNTTQDSTYMRRVTPANATGGAFHVRLTGSATLDDWVEIYKTDSSVNIVTVQNNAGSTDMARLVYQYDRAAFVWDGSAWATISLPPLKRIIPLLTVTNDTSFAIPPGYSISSITIFNTTANAVTGGLKFGTTSGGVDVIAAQAVGANALLVVASADILLKVFSFSAAQTIHIQDVTAWNSASLNIYIELTRLT